MSESRAVKELSPEHAGAVRQLAADWDTATRLGLEGASPETVNEYIAARARAHEEGRGHTFVVTEGNDVAAICGLTGLDTDTPSMFVAVASSMRGRGIASFTIKQMLELAFGELQLDQIGVDAPLDCPDWRRLLTGHGFRLTPDGYLLTRDQWQK